MSSRAARNEPSLRLAALAAALLGPGLAACSSGPAEPPPSTVLTLDFAHVIGGEPVRLGQTYTTRYQQDITFAHVRYWISNVTAVRGASKFVAPASYYLVEQTPDRERLSVAVRGIPPGKYDKIIFHIGVDPPHNASLDLLEGELTPGIGMDWSWDTGYQFFQAEGTFARKDLAGKFSFHAGMDVLYKELTAELPAPIELVAGREVRLSLRGEIDRIFAGLQLDTEADIAGGTVDSPAAHLAGNYGRMFELVTSEGEIPVTATSPNVDGAKEDGMIPEDATPPVLSQPVVALGGAMMCGAVPSRPASEERACMTPFLLTPTSGATYDAGLYTFVTKNGEPVRASAPGVVSDLTFLEHSTLTHSDQFMVTVRPSAGSAFFMEYRNVKDLKVAEGDAITAGQVIGGAGDYFDETVGLVSFGVRRQQEMTQRICPSRFTSPTLEATYQAALGASNTAWPTHAESALCSSASLLCVSGKCGPPSDFAPVKGDIDEGRRIYKGGCAVCHGDKGEGSVGPRLCSGPSCSCKECGDHATLAAGIEAAMPPEGYCNPQCAADVAAFILYAFPAP